MFVESCSENQSIGANRNHSAQVAKYMHVCLLSLSVFPSLSRNYTLAIAPMQLEQENEEDENALFRKIGF